MKHCVIYTIENNQYALDLDCVKCVLQAVEVTEIPHSPKTLLGAISLHGEIINVMNMREILGLPSRELGVNDHFILCEFGGIKRILWVDRVKQIRACTQDDLTLIESHTENYVVKNEEPMTLFFNLEKLCIPH